MVSGVDINFFIDYKEPLEAFKNVWKELDWLLGDLLDRSSIWVPNCYDPRRWARSACRKGSRGRMPDHCATRTLLKQANLLRTDPLLDMIMTQQPLRN